MCGFSSPTLVSYKAFIWKASLEKTVLPPPDFVLSECTEVSEMQSKAQELTAHGLAHSCIQNPGAPVLRPPYECIEGKGVLSKGLPTAPLPRSPDLKEKSFENTFHSGSIPFHSWPFSSSFSQVYKRA